MKPSRRRTKDFKVRACTYCGHADTRAMRQGGEYCSAEPVTIQNGHCTRFIKK